MSSDGGRTQQNMSCSAEQCVELEANETRRELIREQVVIAPGSSRVVPPAVRTEGDGDASGRKFGSDDEPSRYQAVAARATYLGADRPGLQFVVKEVCRVSGDGGAQ